MASLIRIKRSGSAGAPSTLKLGELAYSHLANNGSNGGDTLYIGAGAVDGNGDAPIVAIGGNYFVTQINAATNANTASTIVKRDASGNFTAGTITATLTGNASTATKFAATKNINGVAFDGSADITVTAAAGTLTGTALNTTITDSSLTSVGTITSGTWSASFGAVSGANLTNLTAGNLSGTIPSGVLGNSSLYIGTTSVALNRGTGNLALTGISSITLPGSTSGTAQITPAAAAGTGVVLTLPTTTGNLIGTGDTGTVVGTMLETLLDGSTNKVPGSFGSNTAVPVITVDAKGRITAITTSAISSSANLAIAGGTGTDTVVVGTDTLTFEGGTGVTTTVTNNKVSFAIGQAVGTGSNVTFNDISAGGNLTVTGNLTVNGTTTTVNSTVVTIDDPIFTLGGDTAPAADDNKDRGIEFRWHNGTAAKVGFFGLDDSTGYFTFIPDATNTSEVFSGTQGDIQATNFRGALVGNADTATKLAATKTISITGDLTYTSAGFDGSANVTGTGTLATLLSGTGGVNEPAVSYGSSTVVPVFTVDAKGRITAVTSSAIPTATSSVKGLASFNATEFTVTSGAVAIASVDGGTY